MKRHYLLYPINDIKSRLISFLPSFLICLAGLYITCSMLFMQYGAYQADLYTAEQKYHICLPNVPYEDIENETGETPLADYFWQIGGSWMEETP